MNMSHNNTYLKVLYEIKSVNSIVSNYLVKY